jgi:hypothetical protein
VNALVQTARGNFVVDLETEELEPTDEQIDVGGSEPQSLTLPRVVAAAAAGATIVAVVERKPPLMLSYDAGATWREAGAGLPAGFAVAIGADPDVVLYASRNRLHLSENGGVFWRALAVELPEIQAVELTEA